MNTRSPIERARSCKRLAPVQRHVNLAIAGRTSASESSKAPQLTAISAAVLLALGASRHSFALPTGEQLNPSQVSVQRPTASSMVINQSAPKATVNWQSFSIGGKESVDVRQPSSSSVLLNRVVGVNASEIQGRLTANGQVFLLNPNGVMFGKTAQVSVGGIVASTLSMSDNDFYAGNYKFSSPIKPGSVQVQPGATITAHDYGYIALLGGEVSNQGLLSAKLGTVALAAGDSITLDFAGDGLTKIKVDKAALDAVVANNGGIIADGGQAILTVNSSVQLAQTAVNQRGLIRAQSLLERNGRIVLESMGEGDVIVSGTVDASAPIAGTTGGSVHVSGDRVGIVDHGSITVSGAAGGGEVLIGGGLHGTNAQMRNATATFVGADTTIAADAITSGNGGTVAIWSDGATRVFGSITARGGATSGDGGFVETSGKFLDVNSIQMDASAPNGRSGTWLLDPFDITISKGDDFNIGSNATKKKIDFTASGSGSIISTTTIETALSTADVIISTGKEGQEIGNITWLAGADLSARNALTQTLTLEAAGNIRIGFQPPPQDISAAAAADPKLKIAADGLGALNVTLSANESITLLQGVQLSTNGGSVRMGPGKDAEFPVNSVAFTGTASDPVIIDTRSKVADRRGDVNILPSREVVLTRSEIQTGPGKITIKGFGNFGETGVKILGTILETTGRGAIEIAGESESSAGSFSGTGVTLSADFFDVQGLSAFAESRIKTEKGTVQVTGNVNGGGAGTGVEISGYQIAAGGNITITGHADNGATQNPAAQSVGVQIGQSTIESLGSLTIDGTAASAALGSEGLHAGVNIDGATLTSATLRIVGIGHNGVRGTDGGEGFTSDGVLVAGGNGDAGTSGAAGVLIGNSTLKATSGDIGLHGTGGNGGNGADGGAGWTNDGSANAFIGGNAGFGGDGGRGGVGVRLSSTELDAKQSMTIEAHGGAGGTGGVGGNGGAGFNGGGGGAAGGGGRGGNGGGGVSFASSQATGVTGKVLVTGTGGAGGRGGAAGAGGDGSNVGGVEVSVSALAAANPAQGDAADGGFGGRGGSGGGGVGVFNSSINVTGVVSVGGTGGTGGTGGRGGDGGLGHESGIDGALGFGGFGGNGAPGFVASDATIQTQTGNITIGGISGAGRAAGAGNQLGKDVPKAGLDAAGIFGDLEKSGFNLKLVSAQGDIKLQGFSHSSDGSLSTDKIAGVFMVGLDAATSGNIEIAGGRERGCLTCTPAERGVELGSLSVIKTTGDGSISITGDVPSGVAVLLRGAQIGSSAEAGSIVLRGNGGTFEGGAVQLLEQAGLQTTGAIGFRSGFVHSDLSTGDAKATAIAYVDSAQLTSNAFTVDARVLTSIRGTPSAIVFGSDQHQGAIRIDAALDMSAVASNLAAAALTLENTGAGSGGISINAALTIGGMLALASAGTVTQNAAIKAPNLVLRGFTTDANFVLQDFVNQPTLQPMSTIEVMAAQSEGGTIELLNKGPLIIAPLNWTRMDALTNKTRSEPVNAFGAPEGFFVKVTGGDLLLGRPIPADTTIGTAGLRAAAAVDSGGPFDIKASGGNIALVTDGFLQNNVNATLTPGSSGHFVVSEASWINETRGGLAGSGDMPNRYGCPAGVACGPGGDNIFIYTERPKAIVFIDSAVRDLGVPNPDVGFTVSGVLTSLGDTASQAASGTPAPGASMFAAPGTYTISRGSIDTRVGYILTFVDGTLVVQPQGGSIYRPPVDSPAAGLSVPQICTAIAPASVAYSDANTGDAVDREWSRVKQRLVLSSCTGVRLKESCGEF